MSSNRQGDIVKRSGGVADTPQPLAARLHVIPRAIRPLQAALVRIFRRYFVYLLSAAFSRLQAVDASDVPANE